MSLQIKKLNQFKKEVASHSKDNPFTDEGLKYLLSINTFCSLKNEIPDIKHIFKFWEETSFNEFLERLCGGDLSIVDDCVNDLHGAVLNNKTTVVFYLN